MVAAAVRHADRRVGRRRRQQPARFCNIDEAAICSGGCQLTEVAYVALLGQRPSEDDLFAFQTLVGLLLTNGPGTISAQGAKGAVSADGPEQPQRVQLNKAMLGFLTHCGYAHGGNGYEGVAFLLEQFRARRPRRPRPRRTTAST